MSNYILPTEELPTEGSLVAVYTEAEPQTPKKKVLKAAYFRDGKFFSMKEPAQEIVPLYWHYPINSNAKYIDKMAKPNVVNLSSDLVNNLVRDNVKKLVDEVVNKLIRPRMKSGVIRSLNVDETNRTVAITLMYDKSRTTWSFEFFVDLFIAFGDNRWLTEVELLLEAEINNQ